MKENMEFMYYYGIEAEQFSFYRVPRLLIKDKRFQGLSSDAKLLYGLMLDRMALSMKNGWLDENNRVYIIYALENIMEDLGCSKPTCIKVIRELDSKNGIGLIEKKRRGLGKPDLIYVKNFASLQEKGGEEEQENSVNATEEKKGYLQKEKKLTSGRKEIEPTEGKNVSPNYNNQNKKDQSKKESIHLSERREEEQEIDVGKRDRIDEKEKEKTDETRMYMEMIQENLEYGHYLSYASEEDKKRYEEIYQIICDVVCVKRKTIHVNGEEYPYELVKSCFLKLKHSHVQYVMNCMKDTVTKIGNIRSYLITALYNAPSTMGHYYQQAVQHDMYGGGWEEKGVV